MESSGGGGSQWNQICQFDQKIKQRCYSLYQEPFLIDVRNFLSDWLEHQFLNCTLDADDPSNHPAIVDLINNLSVEIQTRAYQLNVTSSTAYLQSKLIYASTMISTGCPMQPVDLYRHICHCLASERELIRLALTSSAEEKNIKIMIPNYKILHTQSSKITSLLQEIRNDQVKYTGLINYLNKLDGFNLQNEQTKTAVILEKDQTKKAVLQQVSKINDKMKLLHTNQDELLQNLIEFQKKVHEIILNWKKEQETTIYHNISIDEIQNWCEIIVGVIINAQHHIKEFIELMKLQNSVISSNVIIETETTGQTKSNQSNQIKKYTSHYKSQIAGLLKELIHDTFIIETQPEQIIRSGTKFTTRIRFLIGSKLNLHASGHLNVQAYILNKFGIEQFIETKGVGTVKPTGALQNNIQKLQLCGGTSSYSADFKSLRVFSKENKEKNNEEGKLKRKKKGSGMSVLDESFWLLFRTQFAYGGVTYQVYTISVPIKFATNVSQADSAWKSLTWASGSIEDGIKRPECRPWSELAQSLNTRFTMMTKRELSEEHLKYIESKAFSVPCTQPKSCSCPQTQNCLNYSQFCENNLPGTEFTFWNWFYEILKLTAKHFCGNISCKRGPWQDKLILGFINPEKVEQLLLGEAFGTFLLRFSDSQLGAISITFVHSYGSIMRVQPFNSKALEIQPLAECIMSTTNLHYLYPNKPKHVAFGPYLLPVPKHEAIVQNNIPTHNKWTYVRTILRTHLILGEGTLPELPTFDNHEQIISQNNISNTLEIPNQEYPSSNNMMESMDVTDDWKWNENDPDFIQIQQYLDNPSDMYEILGDIYLHSENDLITEDNNDTQDESEFMNL